MAKYELEASMDIDEVIIKMELSLGQMKKSGLMNREIESLFVNNLAYLRLCKQIISDSEVFEIGLNKN